MEKPQEFECSALLKEYITFLQEGFLDNFIYTTIKLAHEYKLPAMKQIEGLSEQRIFNLFEIGIKSFFKDVTNGTVVKGIELSLNDWKNKTLATEITSISYQDIILGYMIRKQALVQYLEYYSPTQEHYLQLVKDLNNLINVIENTTISFFKSDPELSRMIEGKS